MASTAAKTPLDWSYRSVMLWPGLARLWLRGEVRGLMSAVAFAMLLNFALVTTFVWPQLVTRQLPPWMMPTMAWIAVVCFWVAGLRAGSQVAVAIAQAAIPAGATTTHMLQQAQLDYLKGHWLEAETRLIALLGETPGDVEAWLLLASVQRRTHRSAEARQSLARLAELAGSAVWGDEVQRERIKLEVLERGQTSKSTLQIERAA